MAPITFQRMINTLFSDLISKGVNAYLDDLIICSKDGDSNLAKLEAVLLKLREAGLKAKLTKCEFLTSKIFFLGHTVDGDGNHTMDDKISAIKNSPQPQSVEKARSFLGLCGHYWPFIRGFARIASPLTQFCGTRWCNGSTLGSQPRGPGFDPQAESKIWAAFPISPHPCSPSSE